MSRLEELKEKGWVNLTGEERTEYKALSEADTPKVEETKDEVKKDSAKGKPATVTMTKEELERFVESEILKFKKLESEKSRFAGGISRSEVEWHEWKEPKRQNKTATFRLYRVDGDSPWGIIVDWRFFKNVFDEGTRKVDKPVYKIVVQYDDNSRKEYEIEWIEFAKITDIERVEIIKEEKKVMAMSQGSVTKAFKDSQGYIYGNHPDGGDIKIKGEVSAKVPLIVKRDQITVTVKRENGQEFTINADRLNA